MSLERCEYLSNARQGKKSLDSSREVVQFSNVQLLWLGGYIYGLQKDIELSTHFPPGYEDINGELTTAKFQPAFLQRIESNTKGYFTAD